jgi:hypothetical protein
MHYLAKFDAAGRRTATVCEGVHYQTDEERQVYMDGGYVPISEEDYHYYVGNRGQGENGTGYIRDAVTGKPISAPPAPKVEPQEEETPPVDEGLVALAEAMAAQEARIAALEAAKGGEVK